MIVRSPSENHRVFEKLLNAKDVDGLVSRYENDAIVIGPNRVRIVGHQQIRAFLVEALAHVATVKFSPIDIVVHGGIALERLSSTSVSVDSSVDADPVVHLSTVILRLQSDGNWLIAVDDIGM